MIELRHLFAQEDQEIYLSDHLATYIRWLSICKKALHRGPNKHEALKWYLVLTDTILATPNIRCSRVHTSALHIRGDFNTTRYLYTDVKLIQVQLIPRGSAGIDLLNQISQINTRIVNSLKV